MKLLLVLLFMITLSGCQTMRRAGYATASGFSEGMNRSRQNSQPIQTTSGYTAPVHCTSNNYAGTVYTNCY